MTSLLLRDNKRGGLFDQVIPMCLVVGDEAHISVPVNELFLLFAAEEVLYITVTVTVHCHCQCHFDPLDF